LPLGSIFTPGVRVVGAITVVRVAAVAAVVRVGMNEMHGGVGASRTGRRRGVER